MLYWEYLYLFPLSIKNAVLNRYHFSEDELSAVSQRE